eukprot:TRINITY_DN22463_c0_g1_i1.p1 TRINITY_DN22463_c0_g1~~TRINITY_DN22463_c0_g1_i1.p1  ORF type:complete len:1153 (+),score=213.90 TRINITY_DN22463_c0_g1_i1:74-3460(+)
MIANDVASGVAPMAMTGSTAVSHGLVTGGPPTLVKCRASFRWRHVAHSVPPPAASGGATSSSLPTASLEPLPPSEAETVVGSDRQPLCRQTAGSDLRSALRLATPLFALRRSSSVGRGLSRCAGASDADCLGPHSESSSSTAPCRNISPRGGTSGNSTAAGSSGGTPASTSAPVTPGDLVSGGARCYGRLLNARCVEAGVGGAISGDGGASAGSSPRAPRRPKSGRTMLPTLPSCFPRSLSRNTKVTNGSATAPGSAGSASTASGGGGVSNNRFVARVGSWCSSSSPEVLGTRSRPGTFVGAAPPTPPTAAPSVMSTAATTGTDGGSNASSARGLPPALPCATGRGICAAGGGSDACSRQPSPDVSIASGGSGGISVASAITCATDIPTGLRRNSIDSSNAAASCRGGDNGPSVVENFVAPVKVSASSPRRGDVIATLPPLSRTPPLAPLARSSSRDTVGTSVAIGGVSTSSRANKRSNSRGAARTATSTSGASRSRSLSRAESQTCVRVADGSRQRNSPSPTPGIAVEQDSLSRSQRGSADLAEELCPALREASPPVSSANVGGALNGCGATIGAAAAALPSIGSGTDAGLVGIPGASVVAVGAGRFNNGGSAALADGEGPSLEDQVEDEDAVSLVTQTLASPPAAAVSSQSAPPPTGKCDCCSDKCSWGSASLDASSPSRLRSPPLSPLGTAQRHMGHRRPVGLKNLGNTCFLNAALQALAHAPLLAPFFLQGHFVRDLNAANPLGSGGVLAEAFAALLQKLFPPEEEDNDKSFAIFKAELGKGCVDNALAPESFYGTICNCYPLIGEQRGAQQDAHEVLNFLLDSLHEDVNRTRQRPRYEERPDLAEEDMSRCGEERFAAQAWHDHLRRHRSMLVDLCQGQLRSQVKCCECGRTSVTFDPFLFLSLPLPSTLRRGKREPIEAAIREFCAEEKLSGEDRWGCPRCERRVNAKKRLSLWKLPVLLFVHLKRFGFEASSSLLQAPRAWKIEGEVTVPLQRLDLQGLMAGTSPQRVPLHYDLFAAIDHVGASPSVGHYTAACRRADGWWRFDDSRTEFLGRPDEGAEKRVLGEGNYILLFQRRDAPPEPELVREQSHRKPENWPHVRVDGADWSFLTGQEESFVASQQS